MASLPLSYSIQCQSYLIGLWFSLRTHASQIWQNPQQLLHQSELPTHARTSVYQKPNASQQLRGTSSNRKLSVAGNVECGDDSRSPPRSQTGTVKTGPPSPTITRRSPRQSTASPIMMDSVSQAVKQTGLQNIQLGSTLTQEELQRVITAATVSALRHQEAQGHPRQRSTSAVTDGDHFTAHGHAAPAWSRTVSASVLLACTALFATIAGASISPVYESSTYITISRVTYSRGGLHLEGFRH